MERSGRPPMHGRFVDVGKLREELRAARKRQQKKTGWPPAGMTDTGSEFGRLSDTDSIRKLRRTYFIATPSDLKIELAALSVARHSCEDL